MTEKQGNISLRSTKDIRKWMISKNNNFFEIILTLINGLEIQIKLDFIHKDREGY